MHTILQSKCSNLVVALLLLILVSPPVSLQAQWHPTNGQFGSNIESFAVNGIRLFAGGSLGLVSTSDGGALWTPINTALRDAGGTGNMRDMLKKGSTIFAGTNGVFKSTDDGQSWMRVLDDTLEGGTYGLATNDTILYAAGSANSPPAARKWRIFKSADDGASWTECDNGIPDGQPDYFKPRGIAPRGSTVLLAASDGIWRSPDHGVTWALTTGANFDEGSTRCFLITNDTLFAGMGGGNFIVQSTDDGVTWTSPQHNIEVAPNGGDIKVFAMALHGAYMLAGTNQGIYRSPIGADNWTLSRSEGYFHGVGIDTKVFATIGPALFAGGTSGVIMSMNDGDTWQDADSNLSYTTTNGMFVSSGRILDATEGGVAYSDDLGVTWTMAEPRLPFPTHFLLNGSDLYVAGPGIHRSTDNGKTWVEASYPYASQCIAMTDAQHMFLGTGSGIVRTVDGWTTWGYANTGLTTSEVHALVSIGSILIAGTAGGGIFRSDDNADTWTQMNTGFGAVPEFPNIGIVQLATSPDGAGGTRLFAGLASGGVYTSTDSGAHWIAANGPGPQPFQNAVYSFAIVNATTLFAGDGNGNIFLSINNGASWTNVDSGVGFIGFLVNDMAIREDYLFAGPSSNGVWFRRLSEILPSSFSSISGTVYEDPAMLGYRVLSSPPVLGQKIYAYDSDGKIAAIAVTDSSGAYKLHLTNPGTYSISQESNRRLIPNFPSTFGSYTITIGANDSALAKDFGNLVTYRAKWLETNWSSPSTWEGGTVPGPLQAVSIPSNSNIVIDALPHDSLRALRIEYGGSLTGSSGMSKLAVEHGVIIESNSTLTLPTQALTMSAARFLTGKSPDEPLGALAGQTELRVHSNWINRGTFNPGTSKITMLDDNGVISGPTTFYDLNISGKNTQLVSNTRISSALNVHGSLIPDPDDTVFVDNPSPLAIADTGRIVRSTIVRQIGAGETAPYRFESPHTAIQFHAVGTTPSLLTVTTYPDTTPYALSHFDWKAVGGTQSISSHSIAVDSVKKFSRWTFGVPRPHSSVGPPGVHRMYTVAQQGGANFVSHVELRYDASEIVSSTDESSFQLMRNPAVSVPTAAGWNMISLPVIPETNTIKDVYSNTISSAFKFDGGYQVSSTLEFGAGYWMKYSVSQNSDVDGEERPNAGISVVPGWNMIGTVTLPVAASTITSNPPGVVTSRYFGYTGGYQVCDTLFPGKAYWVKAGKAGQLALAGGAAGAVSRISKSPSTELRQLSKLSVRDADGHEVDLFFGSNSKFPQSLYATPPLPPEGGFDVRFADQQMVELASETDAREIPVQVHGAAYPLKISWDLDVKDKELASLQIGARAVRIRSKSSVSVPNSSAKISLLLSTSVAGNVPKEFALNQNFPNPFNPTTTIQYGLPQDARVTLKIFAVTGQEVRTLVDEVETAGYKSVAFNAIDLASGVYFYRIQATGTTDPGVSFTQVRKLLLVK